MGSNMQRQAVPLIRGEAPLVGTGNGTRHCTPIPERWCFEPRSIVDQVIPSHSSARRVDHSGVLT